MKTIKTRIAALAMALMLAVTAAGCGGGDEAEVTPAVEPPELANPDYSPSVSESTPAPESPSAPPEIANPDSPDYVPSTGSTTIPETEDAGDAYIERITFLGDSTTYGLKAYGMLPGGESTQQVWTPSSGTLTLSNQSWATIVYPPTGEEIPIRDAVTAAQPDIMVITLGVNGVSFLDEEAFKSEYKSLVSDIQALSPDTVIICNSIYPVESDYEYLADINNDKITAANGWIADVAAECGVYYLDTYPLLLGSDGFLNPDYGNGDGIHLGPAGFEVVLENIRTHAVQ
ncbi:MAG TPA: SGNH/GDSL hydrolase family protein [Firmicutes bacterium]|nr:SGNH/GDSL hydrolase family protein [Bacillota bacterium]